MLCWSQWPSSKSVKGNERIQIEVAIAVEKCEYGPVNLNQRNLVTDQHACELKGHTAVSVQPLLPGGAPSHQWHRLFRREKLRAEAAPEKPVSRYVRPEKLVSWLTAS
jgi:hypothetical protein